jgi:hypothetical protein
MLPEEETAAEEKSQRKEDREECKAGKAAKKAERKIEKEERRKVETHAERADRKKKKKQKKKYNTFRKELESFWSTNTYKAWEDSGKKKTFAPPSNNEETNNAAIQMQKIARGGWQRSQFRIALLQHKFDTREERTTIAINEVWEENRMDKLFEIVNSEAEKKAEILSIVKEKADEGHITIAYLCKDNIHLRQKKDKIAQQMAVLQHRNERLEKASKEAEKSCAELREQVKRFKETQDQFLEVIPLYKEEVETMSEAAEEGRQFCLIEQKRKVLYMKCIGDLVQTVGSRGPSATALIRNIAL